MFTQRNTIIIILLIIALSFGEHTGILCADSDSLKNLHPVLEPIRRKYHLPAIAAAVIRNGRTVALGVAGLRKVASDVKVTSDDEFHLGSCTKAMTATLVGMLVERGKLRWDMTLAEALPDLAEQMRPEYRNVTLKHLLAHRAGLPPSNKSWPKGKSFMDMHNLPGSPMQQRFAYAEMMLGQEPIVKPGSKYVYSNAGYAVLGVVVEQTVDTPWETMMKEMLFDPLEMTTAGFGAMGSPGKIDQPWQHELTGDKLKPIEPGPFSDNPPVIAPGGTVHCSVGDWAKFIALHLKGARRGKTLLKPETFKVLHTPAFGGSYMGGWNVTERDWAGGRVLTHTGSNGMNFAVVWMAPKRNFAVLVVSNQGKGEVAKACDEAAWTLIKKFLLDKKDKKGR